MHLQPYYIKAISRPTAVNGLCRTTQPIAHTFSTPFTASPVPGHASSYILSISAL